MGVDQNKMLLILGLIGFGVLIWLQETHFKDILEGRAQIVDGDSLTLNGERVRLLGIDAPELAQFCDRNSGRWACGRAATKALRAQINGGSVECEGQQFDKHNRVLATCYAGGIELNRWMVSEGWAVSFGGIYQGEELAARSEKKGIWQSKFELPHIWRRQNPRY